ncbi:MAG: hypothetical protein QM489_00905 [Candidatus Izemoplasma sp.]
MNYDDYKNTKIYPDIEDYTKYRMIDLEGNKIFEGFDKDMVFRKSPQDPHFDIKDRTQYKIMKNQTNAKAGGRPVMYLVDKGDFKNNILLKITDHEAYRSAKAKYHFYTSELNIKFKKDLFKEYPNFTEKQLEIIFRKAWETGHGNGLHEVNHYFEEYCEMCEEVIQKG